MAVKLLEGLEARQEGELGERPSIDATLLVQQPAQLRVPVAALAEQRRAQPNVKL